ncbi:MAG: hypothetical protein HY644_14150 [Acidobacteria bacterium]|nr:hypothetical protein [Acidobacteriota bacterium]
MTNVKRFKIRTALNDEIRDAEVRARKRGDAWEVQVYLLPWLDADAVLVHEEKFGTSVSLDVDSQEAALAEMMRRLKQYFQLEIEERA